MHALEPKKFMATKQKLVLNENLRFLDLFFPGENKLFEVHIQVTNSYSNSIFCYQYLLEDMIC